jgi:hypothetical protein
MKGARGRPTGAVSAPDRRRGRVPSGHSLEQLPFAAWCERYLVQSIDQWAGKPLVLEDFQQEFVDEALA